MRLRSALGYWPLVALAVFAAVPFIPGAEAAIYGQQFIPLFIYTVLALGLTHAGQDIGVIGPGSHR